VNTRNLLIIITFICLSSVHAAERTKIADTADDIHPLLVGQSVPDVVVWTAEGQPLKLLRLAADKPLVLVFYRGGWCPYCNHQLNELKAIEGELVKLGYRLVAISPELPDSLKKMQQDRDLNYQLLSDFRLEVSRAFGIAFRVEPRVSEVIHQGYNTKLQRFAGETRDNLPAPAVFIVDTEGVIQFSYVSPNYKVRLHPELMLKAAEVALKGENIRYKP
jgi:peroxiredoxin